MSSGRIFYTSTYMRDPSIISAVFRFPIQVLFFLMLFCCFLLPDARAQEAGRPPGPGSITDAGDTILDTTYRVSRSGELRYFQAYSSRGGRMILKVFRMEGERLVLVGASPLVTLPTARTAAFSCAIPVSRGDIIGCYCPDTNCVDRLDGGDVLITEGDVGCSPTSIFRQGEGTPAIFAAGSALFDSPSPASTNLILPVAARNHGAEGTRWITSLELFNTSESETRAALYFNLSGVDNTQPAASARILLPARSSLSLDDLLDRSFGIDEAMGSVDIVASAPLMVHGRIFNTGASEGSYGQLVPALPVEWAIGDESQNGLNAKADSAVVFGIVEDEHFRTNLGISNVSGSPLDISITPLEGTRVLADSLAIFIPPYSHRQVSRILDVFGLSSEGREIRLELSVIPPSAGRFLAYASRIDNLSGDAVFIMGEHETPMPAASAEKNAPLCRIP